MKTLHYKKLNLLATVFVFFIATYVQAGNCDLIVKAKGSKANGIYSHFKVLVNDLDCGDKHTSSIFEEYCFSIPFSSSEINDIKIVFDNDKYSIGEDRNLCIHSIVIHDDIPIKANQQTAKYVCINGDEHPYCGMMQWYGTVIFDIKKLRFHPGNVTLASQAEVNAFSSQYLEGSLTITGNDIHDLAPLSNLTRINGALIIRNNPNLIHIHNLNSIMDLDYISIENNPKLEIIDGFSALENCGGMQIRNNNSLKTIKCFNSPDI